VIRQHIGILATRLGSGSLDRPRRPDTSLAPARRRTWIALCGAAVLLLLGFGPAPAAAVQGTEGGAASAASPTDVLLQALSDELARSHKELVLEGLPRPYFIQYQVQDRQVHTLSASYGGLQRRDSRRTRAFASRVRVGSYTLDNTNIPQRGGQVSSLPLEDDYTAIRHAIWRATDEDYKAAVELLARKRAYLKDKTIEDRPDDFSAAPVVQTIEPIVVLDLDLDAWADKLRRLSSRFADQPGILDAEVSLWAGSETRWLVNTEGTKLRTSDSGLLLRIGAQLQAEEGMLLGDTLSYLAEKPDQFPEVASMMEDLDGMCAKLLALRAAPIEEHYVGPVLADPVPAGKIFEALLSEGVCARPPPLGRRDHRDSSFEKKLGLRILPRFLSVYDDPRGRRFGDVLLAGAYHFDDEGVPTGRVDLIEGGVLKTMLAGRAPTEKIKQSTGHGRSTGLGDAQASAACLFLSAEEGLSPDELKSRLIEAAREEGLAYGLWIRALQDGRPGQLGDPIYAYRVYVEDGREELVRGLTFLPVSTRVLKRILEAGAEQSVHNSIGGLAASYIAPAVLFEELELTRAQTEFDKRPILPPPTARPDGKGD